MSQENKGLLYLEFRFPIYDYFSCLNKKEFVYEWILPFLIAIAAVAVVYGSGKNTGFGGFAKYVGGFITILIGFSITSVTILATAGGKNIHLIKNTMSERKVLGKRITIYHYMHINYTFALISEIFTLVFAFILYSLEYFQASIVYRYVFFGILCLLASQVVFLNLRNITCFYLIFSRKN